MDQQLLTPAVFTDHRKKLASMSMMLPNSLAVVNANDVLPTNADGTLRLVPNTDLFYLTGIEQEQTIMLVYPDADEETMRELLFIREQNPELETWEGHKLTRDEARAISGIQHVHFLSEFPRIFHRLMCECEHVYLNSNEHKRAVIEVETREARFVTDTLRKYPLHDYHRLARLLHQLRAVKSDAEVKVIQRASQITKQGFLRVLNMLRPGVNEAEIEAEFAHEFIRNRGRFAYSPIIASGKNACVLHYITNDQECRDGDLLLLDVAASYSNYNADMTRTVPVNGRFTPRQKEVYNAVLRALRGCIAGLRPGKRWKEWQKEAEEILAEECVSLGLLKRAQLRKKDAAGKPAVKEYFMHGVGHPLGLDVHDLGLVTEPMQSGWVMTVEPGIYIPKEGLAVRLENDVLITEAGNIDLMADIPIEVDEIEHLMARRKTKRS